MALGAARRDVVKMVLRHASGMSVAGVVIGGVLSLLAAQGISARISQPVEGRILPLSISVFTAIPLALIATTLLAAAIPARRASRIDPQEALRQE